MEDNRERLKFKFCIDCKNCVLMQGKPITYAGVSGYGYSQELYCNKLEFADITDGSLLECKGARMEGRCGIDGKYWEPKPIEVKAEEILTKLIQEEIKSDPPKIDLNQSTIKKETKLPKWWSVFGEWEF